MKKFVAVVLTLLIGFFLVWWFAPSLLDIFSEKRQTTQANGVTNGESTSTPESVTKVSGTQAKDFRSEATTDRNVNETRYYILDGNIVSLSNQKVSLYKFPRSSLEQVGLKSVGWGNGSIAPVPSSVNEYYLSVSSIAANAPCEFSNKIYLLETTIGSITLLYEENNQILKQDASRGCKKELQLIGTEGSKLIIDYHPLDDGGVCSQMWASPETKWYFDTADVSANMRIYDVPKDLYEKAIAEEKKCLENL